MKKTLIVAALLVACLSVSAMAATVTVGQLGGSWNSDDTRGSSGTNADAATIAQQIQFVNDAPGTTTALKFAKTSVSGGYSKCTVSTVDTNGFVTGGDWVSGFSSNYRYYTNTTTEAPAMKIGIQSTLFSSSQTGFTATRTGESVWDLILVCWDDTPSANGWVDFNLNADTDIWKLYRQSGNGYYTAISSEQSLNQWANDTTVIKTGYTVKDVLFGAGAKVTSVQLGIGSSVQNSTSYVDYIQTSLLNGGDMIDFAPVPEPSSIVALFTGLAGVMGMGLRRRK